jgi:CheY-like chemotaxis protein/anti-sigma regulatory factor (Ser/Thr protein kinase)
VIGMAQVLADETSDPDQADKIAVIIQSGALLLGVLNDLLDLSKIEAGRMDILPEPLDPAALIRQTGQLFQVAAAQKGIGLEISLDPLPEQINADSVRLRQILSNLVANAIKFTDSGTVEIRARAERSGARWRLRVCVEDTGCGISAEDQGRLFARFGQADQSRTRRYGGAGLGLVIARELAQRMEGDVTLESTPGEGSRFTLTLLADAAHETASAAPTPRRVDGLEGRQILLVDDNEVNRMVARCFLEPSGAIITEASGGDEALALFQDQRFDLILLDAHMPGMSGLDVLAQVRKRPGGADIPVIALTADALPGDEARYLKAGMDGYVSKPVDKQILLKACADLASGRRSSTEDTQRRA